MSNLRQAAQQALEVLQRSLPFHETVERLEAHNKAITALRAALAEQEQEPVEWLTGCPECGMDGGCDCPSGTWNQPQRKPLTDEQIEQIADGIPVDDFVGPTTWHLKLARAIEAAHGIKGEA